ncbi:hypothetical protein AVEN_223861-1 [Araneus ventricosus]|uniref:Uncharacterized protein n=1 Tax=Araneus ventricosus TaxID=182803 RepID=A0A4Y2AX89_ARAVE|nr:hypothetical protein AVEN_223861-1 [Araneus ventricosus]
MHCSLGNFVVKQPLERRAKDVLLCKVSSTYDRVPFRLSRRTERRNSLSFSPKRETRFCNDAQGLNKCFDVECDPSEWRLFIDSSKTSLKAVLLPNGNSFTSLPLGHSVHLEENYNDSSMTLEEINYQEHRWMLVLNIS